MQSCRQSVNQQENIVCWKFRCCRKVGKEKRRIDSFRFSIHPPMIVKEVTGDRLTETTEQTPTTIQQKETNIEPQLSRRPPTGLEGRNSQPRLADFGPGFSAHQLRSFRFPRRQFGKSKPVFRSFQVVWYDSWRWLTRYISPYGEDEDKVICHTCTRSSAHNTPADHVNARCSLHHQRLYKLEGCHAKEGRFFAT